MTSWARGVGATYLQMAAGVGSLVVMTPFVLRHVGRTGYGLWAVISSLQTYSLLLDFGMNTATAKYTAEYRVLRQPRDLSVLTSTIAAFVFCMALVIVALGALLAPLVPKVLHLSGSLAESARTAIIVTGLNAAVVLVAGVFGNVIYGHQRTDVWKLFSAGQITVTTALGICLLHFGFGIVGLAWAGVIGNLILGALCVRFIKTRLPGVRIDIRLIDRKTFREILPFGLRTFALGVTSRLLYYSDSIIIAIFLGAAAVAPYEIGYKLCFLSTYLFSVLSFVAFPRLAELAAAGRSTELRTAYLRLVKLTVLVLVPVNLFLLVWGRVLLQFWVGAANVPPNGVLVVLIVMNVFHAVGIPATALLQSAGRNRELVWSETVNALLNIGLSVVLVQRVGIIGAAVATLIAHLASSFWVVQLLPCRTVKLPWTRYVTSTILPPLALGLPLLVLMRLTSRAGAGLVEVAATVVVLSVAYFGAYAILGATREEREQLKRLVSVALKPWPG